MTDLERVNLLFERLNPCRVCPHHCGINRFKDSNGLCRSGIDVNISSSNLHFGEEPPISGSLGSGTIFFTRCNLACVFCQNYPISQLGNGNKVSIEELSVIMLGLQKKGAHNINLVTPSHFIPQIIKAVIMARVKGLKIPLVYNSGGYEDIETLRLLDGIIDIYLPDAKYSDNIISKKYSGAEKYWDINRQALCEMYRQTGNLITDKNGIAKRGLIIRHLILPFGLSGSEKVLNFIAKELSPKIHISIMAQYHPAHKTDEFSEISRKVSLKEYHKVLKLADRLALHNGWRQEL